jgi:DNA helicase HerA-like ATPase
VHLFLEECQEFVPQNPQRGEERMLHAFIRMQKLGRNFGIGSSYISQRPQEVNKKALNMAQTLFVFRTTGTHERKAIEQWIADKALDQDIAGDLPKIQTGTATSGRPSS